MSLEEKARLLAERKKQEGPVDWAAERDWWISSLEALYEDVGNWLAPLVDEGVLTLQRTSTQLTEENIGTYTAPGLVLELSGEAVVLEPLGTLLIGSHGRVDVFRRGRRGKQTPILVLTRKGDEPVWTIWPSRDPRDRQALSEVAFKALVDSLL